MISCKGRCDSLKKVWKKPVKDPLPFLTYTYCRLCEMWIKHEYLWNNLRCPCCHGRVARKPRENSKKKKYIGLLQ